MPKNRKIVIAEEGDDNNDLTKEMEAFNAAFQGRGDKMEELFLGGDDDADGDTPDVLDDGMTGGVPGKEKQSRKGRTVPAASQDNGGDGSLHLQIRIDARTRMRLLLLASYYRAGGRSFNSFLNGRLLRLINAEFDKEREKILGSF